MPEKVKDEYVITRQGKLMVLYPGLLDLAHEMGLAGINTQIVQLPTKENGMVAVVAARVFMDAGEKAADGALLQRSFDGVGDASPENVSRNIAPHLLRMAETRAKARALRDAVNVSAALSDDPASDSDEPPAGAEVMPLKSAEPMRGAAKAKKSQLDLLRTLATELRGKNGVARLEESIGKPLEELTREEAEAWIDRITPDDLAKDV